MKTSEIIEKLKYYTEELPREALEEALERREEITPELLKMLEYTKKNLDEIVHDEDEFFGYIYAFFLLAEFKEQKSFPYLINLLYEDVDTINYILGDNFLDYLPRLLASTYNGDDEALFSIIEDEKIDEFIRSSALQAFAILYLYGVKDRTFIVNYFTKLLNEKKDDDDSYLYAEIFNETEHFRLIELEDIIDKTFDSSYVEDEDIEDLKAIFADKNYEINRYAHPFKGFYDYIEDTIGIMEMWQCFRYIEDEEFENSPDYVMCQDIIRRRNLSGAPNNKIGRNDSCPCGSGKKYKNCCGK